MKHPWFLAVLLGLLVGAINWLGRLEAGGSSEPRVLRVLITDSVLMLVLIAALVYFLQRAAANHTTLRQTVKRTAMAFGVAALVSGAVAIFTLSRTFGHASTALYVGTFFSYAMWPGGCVLGLLAVAYSRPFARVLDADIGQAVHRDRTPTSRSS
jgi:hypothetical protein